MEKECSITSGAYVWSSKQSVLTKTRGENCQRLEFTDNDRRCVSGTGVVSVPFCLSSFVPTNSDHSENCGKKPRCFDGDPFDQAAV